MTHRWIVRDGDGATLSEILMRLERHPSAAIEEGRVFVGRRRARRSDEAVRVGDEVTIRAGMAEPAAIRVLEGQQGVYAVSKPAGLPTEPDQHGGRSLLRSLAELLGTEMRALHAATRLDSMVTGIVIVARGAEATARVAQWQREGKLHRRYVGLALGPIEPARGVWNAPIGKDRRGAPGIGGRGARPAETRYSVLEFLSGSTSTGVTLVRLTPATGRPHQLRLHLAHAGTPLLGDVRHGGPRQIVLSDGRVVACPRPLLHAGSVVVAGEGHAWRVDDVAPEDVKGVWAALGGDSQVLDRALLEPALPEDA